MHDLLKKILALAGLLFGLIWLLTTVVSGFSAPAWVGAVGLACTAGAVVFMVFT